jgi:glucose-6-phosphate isomerase
LADWAWWPATASTHLEPEPRFRNRLVYVPPHWGHRSINVGSEPLISFCAYQADAGHNYGDIEIQGFPKRVFIRDGKEVIES